MLEAKEIGGIYVGHFLAALGELCSQERMFDDDGIGEFQESCRLWCTSVSPRKSFHGRFAVDSLERGVRSGLRQTDWTGCQFRVEPAQRSGWRSLAAS